MTGANSPLNSSFYPDTFLLWLTSVNSSTLTSRILRQYSLGQEHAVKHRKLSSVLCDDLDGWDGGWVGGRSKREGIQVYIQLIHFIVQQKLTQHYKAIICQLKKNKDYSSPLKHVLFFLTNVEQTSKKMYHFDSKCGKILTIIESE